MKKIRSNFSGLDKTIQIHGIYSDHNYEAAN